MMEPLRKAGRTLPYRNFVSLLMVAGVLGCGWWFFVRTRSTQEKVGWKAEDFFKNAKVIALCNAIERNDLDEMEKLIEEGADVSAVGEKGLTPLFWAFFDNKPERFELLLKHGANPNVFLTETLIKNVEPMREGMSVTELAAYSKFEQHFELVMNYGGDPNLVNPRSKRPVIFAILNGQGNRFDRVKLVVAKGCDLNIPDEMGYSPTWIASARDRYDITLYMLKKGADPHFRHKNAPLLIFLMMQDHYAMRPPEVQKQFDALLNWFEQNGQSVDAARALAKKLQPAPRENWKTIIAEHWPPSKQTTTTPD